MFFQTSSGAPLNFLRFCSGSRRPLLAACTRFSSLMSVCAGRLCILRWVRCYFLDAAHALRICLDPDNVQTNPYNKAILRGLEGLGEAWADLLAAIADWLHLDMKLMNHQDLQSAQAGAPRPPRSPARRCRGLGSWALKCQGVLGELRVPMLKIEMIAKAMVLPPGGSLGRRVGPLLSWQ